MDVKITPYQLEGTVYAPPSKSVAHRAIICAMLASGTSRIHNIGTSDDIVATIGAARALGAQCQLLKENGQQSAIVTGIISPPTQAVIDCGESGSTLRFFVPIAAALGVKTVFLGRGELPNRPMEPLISAMEQKGVSFSNTGKRDEMFTMEGALEPGHFLLPGDISSQYITGLLLALPLLGAPSEIHISTSLESSSYVDLTLEILDIFQVTVQQKTGFYRILSQSPKAIEDFQVEGDYSAAAFWLVAAALGFPLSIAGLSMNTVQGDKHLIEVLKRFGADVSFHSNGHLFVKSQSLTATRIDASDIPDSVPILAVLATQALGTTTIYNAGRLRIKECDRLHAITQGLTALGATIEELPEGLKIHGQASLHGGVVSSFGDHRIAMALAIAATVADTPVIITQADCVSKSYPAFFNDFSDLGGIVDVIHLEP